MVVKLPMQLSFPLAALFLVNIVDLEPIQRLWE